MRIYFAGAESGLYNKLLAEQNAVNRLLSYHYIRRVSNLKEHFGFPSVFIDSGAFSAMTQGVKIDIDNYIAFIKTHKEHVDIVANLDVIGDAEASYNNYLYIKSKGLEPLAVYHFNTDIKYLIKYLEQTKFIAFGGMVGNSSNQLIPWLDRCFTVIRKYWPVKVHSFGVTSKALIRRYPFYSMDSTSWLSSARYGGITEYKNGNVVSRSDEAGLRLSKMLDYKDIVKISIQNYQQLEQFGTKLWTHRGITWK